MEVQSPENTTDHRNIHTCLLMVLIQLYTVHYTVHSFNCFKLLSVYINIILYCFSLYSHIPNRRTYTFIYFTKICSPIRHYSGLYVNSICSQSTLYDFYLVCLLAAHYFESSPVRSLLPFCCPVAHLEAHSAGVPGNCHLPASLSCHSGTRKLLLTKCLRICNKYTNGYIWSTTTMYVIGPAAFA